jgi:hypothetical protein
MTPLFSPVIAMALSLTVHAVSGIPVHPISVFPSNNEVNTAGAYIEFFADTVVFSCAKLLLFKIPANKNRIEQNLIFLILLIKDCVVAEQIYLF